MKMTVLPNVIYRFYVIPSSIIFHRTVSAILYLLLWFDIYDYMWIILFFVYAVIKMPLLISSNQRYIIVHSSSLGSFCLDLNSNSVSHLVT